MKQNVLYGVGGPDQTFRVVRYRIMDQKDFSATLLRMEIDDLRYSYPNIERFFLVDNRPSIHHDCIEAFKKNTIIGWIEFKDLLERIGVEVK